MAIHKYIFLIENNGIKSYRVNKMKQYEKIRYKGEDIYPGININSFFEWFIRVAAISDRDYVDFCFLSYGELNFSLNGYLYKDKSSWNRSEIIEFCREEMNLSDFRIILDDKRIFFHQENNIYKPDKLFTLHLKCIPEFIMDAEESADAESGEESAIYRYYRGKLDEL